VDRVLAAVDEHGPGAAAAAALEAVYFGRCGRGEARQAMSRLQRIAPPLIGPVEGVCPQCASAVSAWFDPGAFVIAELGRRAVTIFEDVHLLASHYGWSEDAVLSLPRARRAAYVALIAAGSGAS
jgi:hypothetical protein